MKYSVGTKIYASTPGVVVLVDNHDDVGNRIIIKEHDAPDAVSPEAGKPKQSFMSYQALDTILVEKDEKVVPGELIALSGETGSATNGPHLHFMRGWKQPTFDRDCTDGVCDEQFSLVIPPIDGKAKLVDDDVCDDPGETPPCDSKGPSYLSTNAGVGYKQDDTRTSAFATFETIYRQWSGWSMLGRPLGYNYLWQPCRVRNGITWATHWRYDCTDGTYSGQVQTLFSDVPRVIRAIARRDGGPGFLIPEPILAGYTELYQDWDWVHWIGYPIADYTFSKGIGEIPHWYQKFQNGEIRFWPEHCTVAMYKGPTVPPHTDVLGANANAIYIWCSADPLTPMNVAPVQVTPDDE